MADVNMRRYAYFMACLVGRTVVVNTVGNSRIQGIFHSGSFENSDGAIGSEFLVVLLYARELPSADRLSGRIIDKLIIDGKDIVSLTCEECSLDFESDVQADRTHVFKTDVEISGGAATAGDPLRELEKWEPDPGDAECELSLGSLEQRTGVKWDQFEANARRFQVKSTYQEELYTTPLDVATIPQSVKDKADQIAREIEAAQFGAIDAEKIGEGDLEDDEEARFGAVRGTGAYRSLGVAADAARPASTSAQSAQSHPSTQSVEPAEPPSQPSRASEAVASQTAGVPASAASRSHAAGARVEPTVSAVSKSRDPIGGPSASPTGRKGPSPNSIAGAEKQRRLATGASIRAVVGFPKNINALNLEPALPKLDDQGRSDLFKVSPALGGRAGAVSRNPLSRTIDRQAEKAKFLSALNDITDKMGKIDWATRAKMTAPANYPGRVKNFRFNPNADAFTPKGQSPSVKEPLRDSSKRLRFQPLTHIPKMREAIDRILLSRMLPSIINEKPSAVSPGWNAELAGDKRKPFSYTQILGDLHLNATVSSAVTAAVQESLAQERKAGSRTAPSQRSNNPPSASKSGDQPATASGQKAAMARPRSTISPAEAPSTGQVQTAKPGLETPTAGRPSAVQRSMAAAQPLQPVMMAPSWWMAAPSMDVASYNAQSMQVQPGYPPAGYPAQGSNGGYYLVSRGPVLQQGGPVLQPGMVAFMNEDGTLQPAHAYGPPELERSPEEGGLVPAAFPGGPDPHYMGLPGSNVVLIPPGAVLNGAFIAAAPPGSETPKTSAPQLGTGSGANSGRVAGSAAPGGSTNSAPEMHRGGSGDPRWTPGDPSSISGGQQRRPGPSSPRLSSHESGFGAPALQPSGARTSNEVPYQGGPPVPGTPSRAGVISAGNSALLSTSPMMPIGQYPYQALHPSHTHQFDPSLMQQQMPGAFPHGMTFSVPTQQGMVAVPPQFGYAPPLGHYQQVPQQQQHPMRPPTGPGGPQIIPFQPPMATNLSGEKDVPNEPQDRPRRSQGRDSMSNQGHGFRGPQRPSHSSPQINRQPSKV